MRFSVAIPTYCRAAKLNRCLQALFSQDFDHKNYEIIVVDDGSTDETAQLLKNLVKKSPVHLKILRQENKGQGVARNKAIDEARGEIIVLVGDDIYVAENFLSQHNKSHTQHPEASAAVLGFVTWWPQLEITPLMRFMEQGGAVLGKFGGHQFAYDLLEGKDIADYRFFYTANISLKRELLIKNKFDPWFSGYGWEDIELGYRLQKTADMKLYYNKEATAFHDHPMTFESFASRMREIGRSSHLLHKKYPELRAIPTPRKQMILALVGSGFFTSLIKPLSKNMYFYALSKKYFLEGVKEGI